jgi:hypothetical protein
LGWLVGGGGTVLVLPASDDLTGRVVHRMEYSDLFPDDVAV